MSQLLFAADLYLVGLGVTVALVIYPSFHFVGAGQWSNFHGAHTRRMAYSVSPAWALQGIGSLWWLLDGPIRALGVVHALAALAAVALTVFKAVPIHQRLERHHDSVDIRQLQCWHLVRTLAWILCALLSLRLV